MNESGISHIHTICCGGAREKRFRKDMANQLDSVLSEMKDPTVDVGLSALTEGDMLGNFTDGCNSGLNRVERLIQEAAFS